MTERKDSERHEPEIVYSRSLKAGKRLYYLDVKKARNEDLYLCITESKRKSQGDDELPVFEKHKIFLYKEDFESFKQCLQDVMGYVEQQFGTIEQRQEYIPQSADEPQNAEELLAGAAQEEELQDEEKADMCEAPEDLREAPEPAPAQAKERRSIFQRFRRKD